MSSSLSVITPEVDYSILISCYFEEKSIDEFYARLSKTLEASGRSYEIIFVNDGSTDRTYTKLEQIFEQDTHVSTVIDFVKNSGQSNAKTPGVMLGKGKAFVLIDSDLQLEPEELPALMNAYEDGCDLVSGYRSERRDSWMRKLPSWLANMIMRKAANCNLRDFGCTYKIYDGQIVRAFEFGPFKPWRPVPVISMARNIKEVPVTHHPRKYGKSGWTFRKLFAYNMENIVQLSDRPFQLLGGFCILLALLFLVRVMISIVVPFSILPQVTNGLLLNMLMVALLILMAILSGIGELVIRNFIFLNRKPAFVIRTMKQRPVGEHGSNDTTSCQQ